MVNHSMAGTLARPWRAVRRIWVPANYGYIAMVVLGALAVATTWLGLVINGSASSPAPIPGTPGLYISFAPGSAPPASLDVYTSLLAAAAPVRLVVTASGDFARHQSSVSWTLDVTPFTGYLCPGQGPLRLVPLAQQGADSYYVQATSPVVPVSGSTFLTVQLCWNSGAPVAMSGAYVSAALSSVQAAGVSSGTLTRSLVLSGSSLSSYTIAGGIPPTGENVQRWLWSSSLSGAIQDQARYEIPVIASSLPGLQHDNQDAFLSGILFGIAGGAGVSLIPALLDAVDRRKSRKEAAAGDRDQAPAPAPAIAPPPAAGPHSDPTS